MRIPLVVASSIISGAYMVLICSYLTCWLSFWYLKVHNVLFCSIFLFRFPIHTVIGILAVAATLLEHHHGRKSVCAWGFDVATSEERAVFSQGMAGPLGWVTFLHRTAGWLALVCRCDIGSPTRKNTCVQVVKYRYTARVKSLSHIGSLIQTATKRTDRGLDEP